MNWLTTISVEDWNHLLDGGVFDNVSSKISEGDFVCFYVVGTSTIKGIGKKSCKKIILEKTGDLNYFGISSKLQFVKDKENVVKYLRNFKGVANLGKPFGTVDLNMINSEMTILTSLEGIVEVQKEFKSKSLTPGSPHELLYIFEISLRNFISSELAKISSDWTQDCIPDPKMFLRWQNRMENTKKYQKWFKDDMPEIIHFSDFYDLITLIVNRRNWKKCFERTFGKQSVIETKLYELVHIRNKLAHSRPLTEEEMMALNLYSKQILRLINPQACGAVKLTGGRREHGYSPDSI